ncbi:MAG: NYN domain-containing protein [Ruminococcus sp.]
MKKPKAVKKYLLVDGYNIIFAWEELKALAEVSIDGARDRLMDIMSNYQGYRNETVILVFDAYRVEGHVEEVLKYHNIYVVYTREAETADQYIEKTVHEIGRKYEVTVATSDRLEQIIIRGGGGRLISARELEEEIEMIRQEIRQEFLEKRHSGRNYLFNHVEEDMADELEKIRLGKKGEDSL